MQRTLFQRFPVGLLGTAALSLVFLAGCGGDDGGPQLYPVKGEVTFDGEPIESGRITFREETGDRRAFSAPIENGEYELEAAPGPMTVQIIASRPTGKFDNSNPGSEPTPIGEMYIPEKYNSKTELTAEVSEDANQNVIPFQLTSS